jgi:hypothetical protein
METATITRESLITGRPFTRTVYIVRDWDSYIGLESGRPVIIRNHPTVGPEFREILSAAEQATIQAPVSA